MRKSAPRPFGPRHQLHLYAQPDRDGARLATAVPRSLHLSLPPRDGPGRLGHAARGREFHGQRMGGVGGHPGHGAPAGQRAPGRQDPSLGPDSSPSPLLPTLPRFTAGVRRAQVHAAIWQVGLAARQARLHPAQRLEFLAKSNLLPAHPSRHSGGRQARDQEVARLGAGKHRLPVRPQRPARLARARQSGRLGPHRRQLAAWCSSSTPTRPRWPASSR